jgi:hypothetical protein
MQEPPVNTPDLDPAALIIESKPVTSRVGDVGVRDHVEMPRSGWKVSRWR